jgi:sterol desaturase/sphingolipid hydroxylase (fatty acid hydroxylase superfamily)
MHPLVVATVATSAFLVLLVAEHAWPLRSATQPWAKRVAITVGFAASAGLVVGLAYPAIVFRATELASNRGLGLLRWAHVPLLLRPVVSFVLLDYSLWLWHWMNHRVPLLWRFHATHHLDLDLDVMTAWRFHFGEMLASVSFRAAQVVVFGVDVSALVLWELTTLVCIQFHHSNVRLPASFERILRLFLITPRLHGIHHSTEPRDVSSNFGTILSVWDGLHRVHRWATEAPPAIGLAEIRESRAVSLLRALALPFSRATLRPPRVPG